MAQAPTPNQMTSAQQNAVAVIRGLDQRREEIESVLPNDVPWDQFKAVVNQAFRASPEILECTVLSIINACIKSAYDGLRLDGREAALVMHKVNVAARNQPDKWEKQAQYFPMYQGLVQQLLRGGDVVAIEADIIHMNDKIRVTRGTNPTIEHEIDVKADRGEAIGVYAVATLKGGYKQALTPMSKDEILDIMKSSKAGVDAQGNPKGIWKRWPKQMWLKTALRQLRKTLPQGPRNYIIRDMEAEEQWPDMAKARIPAPAVRPERQRALPDQSGTETGVPLDLGGGQREEDYADPKTGELPAKDQAKQAAPAKTVEQKNAADDGDEIPEDEEAWRAWVLALEKKIEAAETVEAVQELQETEAKRIAAAAPDRRDWVTGHFTDRLADLAPGN
jgi:recombination protein RecT